MPSQMCVDFCSDVQVEPDRFGRSVAVPISGPEPDPGGGNSSATKYVGAIIHKQLLERVGVMWIIKVDHTANQGAPIYRGVR